jgi:hypothetical protein
MLIQLWLSMVVTLSHAMDIIYILNVLNGFVCLYFHIHSTIVYLTPFNYYHLTILNTHNNVNYKGCKGFTWGGSFVRFPKLMGGGEAMLVVLIWSPIKVFKLGYGLILFFWGLMSFAPFSHPHLLRAYLLIMPLQLLWKEGTKWTSERIGSGIRWTQRSWKVL